VNKSVDIPFSKALNHHLLQGAILLWLTLYNNTFHCNYLVYVTIKHIFLFLRMFSLKGPGGGGVEIEVNYSEDICMGIRNATKHTLPESHLTINMSEDCLQ
jgi:hypothetical protein